MTTVGTLTRQTSASLSAGAATTTARITTRDDRVVSDIGADPVTPAAAGGVDQPGVPVTLTIQSIPKRSVSIPNVSPQGAFSIGTLIVAPSARPSQ